MSKQSAGILLYNISQQTVKVMLVHPGGPFFSKKDEGAWSIPKGEFDDNENAIDAARREFYEETGMRIEGSLIPLRPVKQKGGKIVYAWALKGDLDVSAIQSNTFKIEWPPKSGEMKIFPEIDKGSWFDLKTAKIKILSAQIPFLEELAGIIGLKPV